MAVLYDPPSGWRYGFPREYKPLPGESLAETLLRDGYPQNEIDNGGARYCRFIGERDELEAMAQRHVDSGNDPARDHPADYCASEVRNNSEQDHDDESLLTPEEEAEIVADINSGRWPYLLPVSNDNKPISAQAQPAGISRDCDGNVSVVMSDGTTRKGDWIQTFTGRKFWPIDPRADEVNIDDIAHALSMLCRYSGHCLRFYSVAEHSVHVARWLFDNGYPYETILAGLLHDATEAYVADVPRPLKQSLPTYKDVETRVWRAIAARYGLEAELPAEVHEADNRILADEIQQNMKPMEWHANHDDPLGVTLEFWPPAVAEHEFIRFFRFLERRHEPAVDPIEARHDREASRADWLIKARKEEAA